MAKVWLVRRRGGQWIAPGGQPAVVLPLAEIRYPLDLGTHRRLSGERPRPAPEVAPESARDLSRVMVEVGDEDLRGRVLSGFSPRSVRFIFDA